MTGSPLPPVGTIVTIDDPRCVGLFKVTGHGPKNAALTPVDADGAPRPGRGARMPGWMLHPFIPGTSVTSVAGAPMPPVPAAIFDPGMLVKTSAAGVDHSGVFVVIADKGAKVNVARLGGDNGRYWRLPPSALTVIPLAELAGHLEKGNRP